jgi:superfamily II DNA/RNA helicase
MNNINCAQLVGGTAVQSDLLQSCDILIATPGRLIALIESKGLPDFSSLQTFIVDECDRMLSMGFLPEIKTIYQQLPKPK